MKHLLLLLFIAFTIKATCQVDTVHFYSGKYKTGIVQVPFKNYIELMVEGREIILIRRDSINYVSVHSGVNSFNALIEKGYNVEKGNASVFLRQISDEKQSEYLRRAGKLISTSGNLQIIGIGLGAIGIGLTTYGGIEGKKEFIYTGIGFSSLAFIFELIAPGFKIEAGNFLIKAGGGL